MTYAISFPGFTQSVGLSSCIRDSLNNVKRQGNEVTKKGFLRVYGVRKTSRNGKDGTPGSVKHY